MTFVLNRVGARREIEKFLAAQRGREHLYWITYVAHAPPEELLTFLGQKKTLAKRLRIICRHPGTARPDETILTKETFSRLSDLGVEVRGIWTREDSQDDDEAIDIGALHAKFIVSETELLIGSFNFSAGSVSRACESTVVVDDTASHKTAHETALELWDLAEALTDSDCQDDPELVAVEGDDLPPPINRLPDSPSQQRSTRMEVRCEKPTKADFPAPYSQLIAALDESLMDWPRGSGKSWQYDCFRELEARGLPVDVLFLPVGCGKTHIALRWLLERLAKEDAHSAKRVGVFLTPNAWVQRSVEERVNALFELTAARFKGFRAKPQDVIVVGRASDVRKRVDRQRVAAVVADEVHNWNHKHDRAETTYTGYLDEVARRPTTGDALPLLGLSATPCRIEAESFSTRHFVNSWMHASYFEEASLPMRRFDWAVEEGVVSRPIWHSVAADQQDTVKDLLLSRNIAYGDYSQIVLRDIWRAIAGSAAACARLAKEIVAHAKAKKRTKCVIFLPPVGDESSQFVRALKKAASGGEIFDFRAAESADDAGHVFSAFASFKGSTARPGFLLTIDRFSEGVSVDDIDMLVLLRATLSPRVAVQQLGRGCRLNPGKTSFDVLDAVQFHHLWQQWDGGLSSRDDDDDNSDEDGGDDYAADGFRAKREDEAEAFRENVRAFLWRETREQLTRLAKSLKVPSSGTKKQVFDRITGSFVGQSIDLIRHRKANFKRHVSDRNLRAWAKERNRAPSRTKAATFEDAWRSLMVRDA